MSGLHTKYRPNDWAGVVGHETIIASLQRVIATKSSRAFLFTGPSGVGKTTLARILATEVGCHPRNLMEIDAATYTGIDAMRSVTELMAYLPFGESTARVIIIDEAHALSKQAWQSLLKSVEEPPSHVWWVFCSTDPSRIPDTIRTRCVPYDLKPVDGDDIFELLCDVAKAEHILEPKKAKDERHLDTIYYIAQQSYGSPRRALILLAQCANCRTVKEAAGVLQRASVDDESTPIIIVRALLQGKLQWGGYCALIRGAKDQNPESVRLVIVAYLTKVLLDAKTDRRAGRLLELLDAFGVPYNPSEGFAPLLLSIGRVLFSR